MDINNEHIQKLAEELNLDPQEIDPAMLDPDSGAFDDEDENEEDYHYPEDDDR